MKQYAAILLLVILIASCAPKEEPKTQPTGETPVENIPAGEPEEIITQEPKEPIIEEKVLEENTITIKEDSFYPAEKTIEIDTEIKWTKKDDRVYKIACYLNGNRVTLSPDLKEGDSFTYTFLKEGEYTCITSPYGLRNIIKVEAKQQLLSPTGGAIIGENKSIKGASLAAIALVVMMLLLFFKYNRKKAITRNFK